MFTFLANTSVENGNVQHTKLLHVPVKNFLLLVFIRNVTLNCLSLTVCTLQLFYLCQQAACQYRLCASPRAPHRKYCTSALTVSSAPAMSQSTTCTSEAARNLSVHQVLGIARASCACVPAMLFDMAS